MFIVLGLLPLALVFFFFAFPRLWSMVPLVRSADLSRSIWYPMIFLGLAFGHFLEELLQLRIQSKIALFIGLISLVVYFTYADRCFGYCHRIDRIDSLLYGLNILSCGVILMLYRKFSGSASGNRNKVLGGYQRFSLITVAFIGIFAALLPASRLILGTDRPAKCSGYYFLQSERAEYYPSHLLNAMEPWSRVAANRPSWEGYEQTAVYNSVLGSNGRSIIASADLSHYLFKIGAVKLDDGRGDYHFASPWDTKMLSALGIRYILESTPSKELEQAKWKRIAEGKHEYHNLNLYLYENPDRPTLFYLLDEKGNMDFVREFKIEKNSATIHLPPLEAPYTFVATFAYRSHWKAEIDGKPAEIFTADDRLMRVVVAPGTKIVRLSYELYTWMDLVIFFVAGVVVLALAYRVADFLPRLTRRLEKGNRSRF